MSDTAIITICDHCPYKPKERLNPLVVTQDGRVSWKNQPVKLTLFEYKILVMLVSPPGQIRSMRELYDTLHRPGFVAGDGHGGYRSNVRSTIKRIREKFKKVQPDFDNLVTYQRFGYIWQENL